MYEIPIGSAGKTFLVDVGENYFTITRVMVTSVSLTVPSVLFFQNIRFKGEGGND